MEKSKLVGHTASLNKNLQHYLSKFEKNQQWADVAPLLMKIEGLLKTHPSPYIEEKVQLAKRLAQCLNPQLTSPLHLSVLKIYDQIFKNMINYNIDHKADYIQMRLEDMAIFSVGMFPFFQHASNKVKPFFLELIQRHYIPLGRELIPMISGLVSSIIPGLDDQNESQQKLVIQTLDQAQVAVGRRYLIGAVWMSILRIPRCRPSGIKYLQRSVARMPQDEEEEQEEVDSSDQEYSEDEEEKQIVKEPIDKAITSSPTKSLKVLPAEEEEKQVETEQQVVSQAELKSAQIDTEEILNKDIWRQQQLKDLEENIDSDCNENNFPNKSSLVLNALLACLEDDNQLTKRLVLDFMFSHLKLTSEFLNETDKLVLVEGSLMLLIRKDLSVTRRVNQWLFGKPDNENKYQLTEKNQFVIEYLVNGFVYAFKNTPTDAATSTFPIKLFQNFYMEHDHMLGSIIPTIAYDLLNYIYTYSSGFPFSSEVLKAGKRLVESTASHLALLVESITSLTMKADNEKTQTIINIVQFFFSQLLDSENFDGPQIEALIKTSVSNLLRSLCNLKEKQLTEYTSVVLTSQLALSLLKQQDALKLVEQKDVADYDQALQEFGQFYQVISTQLTNLDASQRLFRNASEILIKGQRFRSDKQLDRLPDWFGCITRIIRDQNPSIALLAIESMIELLISEKLDPIYAQFKQLVVEESRSKISKNQLIQGFDYTRLTLEKLWSLLDYQVFHDRIIDMIVNLSKVFPQLFTDVVAGSFSSNYVAEKENAIRRFAVFWKLTSTYYKCSGLSRELQDLNKVGLFNMLDFLEHDSPMIRHTAKNWLLESMPTLNRILDPLFEVLVQSSSSFYVTERKQVFFSKVYDTRRTNEAIKKLKSILATYSDLFVSYMQHTELSDFGNDVRLHFTNESEPVITKDLSASLLPDQQPASLAEQLQQLPKQDEPKIVNKVMTYLDLLAIICLKYIQAQAIESMSVKFFSENAAVNASACEFVELLIIHIDHPGVSLCLAEYIMPPLQIVLYHAVENKDLVMQVQLLNLFKVVFFHSQFRRKPTATILKNVQLTMTETVSNAIFLPTLISGMATQVLYVRAQYIQFISTCIPLLAEFLSWQILTNCVKEVLAAYFKMIKAIAEAERSLNEDTNLNKQSTFEYLQGSQHEISSVLAGVKMILKHILGLEERDDIQYDKPIEKGYTVTKIVKTVLTFGLSNVHDPNKFQDKPIFAKYEQTCEQIMLSLPSILELYINCWDSSKEFMSFSETSLTGLGCDVYTFEKYNNYNKQLPELFRSIPSLEKNLVKPQILTMMKPLFMHYSRQFISAILALWIRECRQCSGHFSLENQNASKIMNPLCLGENIFLQKTIELLVMMNCPTDLVLDSFLECEQMKEIVKFYAEQGKKGKKQALPVFNFAIVEQEAQILYFLYNYFKHVYIDPNNLKKETLTTFWTDILSVIRQLAPCKAPSTGIWLLELTLLLTRKYSPKEIIGDQKIRNELHEFINDKLKYLASYGAKQVQVYWNDPALPDKPGPIQEQAINKFRTILPFNPSIFEIYQQLIEFYAKGQVAEKDGGMQFEVTEIEKLMFGNLGEFADEDLVHRYRMYSIKTLRRIGLEVLQNSYAMERTDRVVVRTKEWMDILFPLMLNKAPENQVFVQIVSELLFTLLDKAKQILIKTFRGNILDIFNREDFFILNRKTLKYWEHIINWVVIMDKSDLFSEYLDKVTLQSYFFSKENDDNKKRIKSVERICFVIFSGDRDRYTKKLWTLIEKISEVIKSDNVHPSLLILILFCVRILILRLSVTQLTELFRNIWPMLLTMLIQIFNKHRDGPTNAVPAKNINLVLAALKLIEMISLTHQDDFFLNQWVFMNDYFGLKFEPNRGEAKKMTPFQYQPYFSNFVNAKYSLQYKNVPQLTQTECKKKKRTIIIQQVKVETEAELEECALRLGQYLIHLNELRTEVDLEQVEEMIEEDFIHLDEFIFKI